MAQCHKRAFVTPPQPRRLIHTDRFSAPLAGVTLRTAVIEGLHHAAVEFRSLAEDFDTSMAAGKLQLSMVLAFSEWWRNSNRERTVAGQAKVRVKGVSLVGRRA